MVEPNSGPLADPATRFLALDLFSGPGGLTLGMKAAGITPICSVEQNADAVATYRRHTPGIDHRNADIQDVSFSKFRGKIQVVYGGPPCQPFSLGGLRKGEKDRRDMLPAFLRAVKEVQPEAVLIENVPGLATKAQRHNLDLAIDALSRLGFSVTWSILSAADYGVPQKRRRLFIVGLRTGGFVFPSPSHGPNGQYAHVPASTVVSYEPLGEPAKSPVHYAPRVSLRPNPYGGHVFKGGGRPLNLAVPSYTVYASAGGNKTHWVDTAEIVPAYHEYLLKGGKPKEGIVPGARRLTVQESSLIQSFPADLDFAGSKSSQFRQIGDAVPPLLGKAIGSQLVDFLDGRAAGIAESRADVNRRTPNLFTQRS